MKRTITVKGTGRVSVSPDTVILSMELVSRHKLYEKAMEAAAQSIDMLQYSLICAGFEKNSLKTADFDVNADYDYEQNKNGVSRRVFKGYSVSHRLKLEFALESGCLTRALSAVNACPAHPELNIAFTVRDAEAVRDEMLAEAAANAKRNAETLCAASGCKLGSLLNIDYNRIELNIVSQTRYLMADEAMTCNSYPNIDIEPDDIDLADSVTFVWELK